MTNRFATLLLTATLGLAAAQTTPATSSVADTSLTNATVTIEIGRYAGPLSSLLAALAKSAGYGLILDTNVDALPQAAGTTAATGTPSTGTGATGTATADTARPVVYSFQNKPFNEVWPLLMDVYGLSYDVVTLAGQPVLRVSNTPIQRTVTLKNADATQASQQVKLFFGTPTYSETAQKDAQGNTVGVTRTLVDVKLDSATLRIVPDVRSNAVIVRGTNKEVAEVTRLLAQLDSTPGAQAGSASTPEVQTVQRVYTVKGAQADIVALLAAQYPGLKVTPVGQTGQLVVTGPQNQLDAALTLLGQVDRVAPVVAGAQITQRIFQLVNASAEEVKATLEGTLARDLGTTTAATTGTAAAGTPPAATGAATTAQANTATIIADKRTNTVIVRGTADQVAQVADLIPQLDQKVPQINVQVRIQEITEKASRALGVNWSAGFGGFSVSSSNSAGLGVSFDPTRSLLGFNLGASLNALQGQGLSKSVYDGSITMQSGQRSLGASGETQNASSTAAASIKSGGRLEVNIPSAAANVPAIQKQIDLSLIHI